MMWPKEWGVALVGEDAVFDPEVHFRRDLPVKEVRIRETETDGQARVSLTLATWTEAFYSPTRNTTLFLSRVTDDGQDIVLMAKGRMVSIPLRGSTQSDLPVLEFDCSPADWRTPEAAVCASKKLLPMYDDVLVARERRTDPKEILDGWHATVHCNRASWAFTTPDKLGHGLPVIEFPNPWNDPLPTARSKGKPVAQVDMTLTVEFVQAIDQIVDLTSKVGDAAEFGFLDTLTPEQLEKSWFKAGAQVNGCSGWTWVETKLTRIDPSEWPSPLHLGTPLVAGPFTSAPEKQNYVQYYSWVVNRTLTVPYTVVMQDGREVKRFDYVSAQSGDPGHLHGCPHWYDRSYYNVKLTALATIRQKRTETIHARLSNAAQKVDPGQIRYLSIKCQDIRDMSDEKRWRQDTHYSDGDKVWVGLTMYECLVAHLSAAYWMDDQELETDGVKQTLWQSVPQDQTTFANPAADSYFETERGENTFLAMLCKARRILADSTRNVDVKIRHELTDSNLLTTTANNGHVTTPPYVLDNGGCTAKITAVEIYSSQDDEYIDVTLTAATGSGKPYSLNPVTYDERGDVVETPIFSRVGTVSVTGQDWDTIGYAEYATANPPDSLPPLGASVEIQNGATEQAEYVAARDFVYSDPERNDDKATLPDTLLKECPTNVVVRFTQIGGQGTLALKILPTMCDSWQGPRQYNSSVEE